MVAEDLTRPEAQVLTTCYREERDPASIYHALHRDAALRALGNAVVPAVAYEVGLWLREIQRREHL